MKYIFICLLIVLTACGTKKKAESANGSEAVIENNVTLTDAQLKNAALTIASPEMKALHGTIRVNGKVDVPPQSMVSVSFPLGGYLKNSHLLPGMEVKKGEVIATMEDKAYVQLQQDFLVAKAKMEFLASDVQRQKELSDNDATSKKSYQQVLSEFKTQQVMIKALDEELRIVGLDPEKLNTGNISRTISLRSPITGFVSRVNVNIGKYVNPSDVLFELVNPDDIHAALTVFEKDINQIRKGMKAMVALADKPGKQYEVEVLMVTRNVEDDRSGLVHCHFENENHDLLPGMFLTGTFRLEAKPTIAVPEETVLRYEGKEYVFLVKDTHHFMMQQVETGSRQNGYVELKDQPGIDWLKQKLVTGNGYSLLGKLKNTSEE
ncbi:efflux RND transporter periplasmic adaptor subunit [Sediminibacterium ginsengisoli]|uniref:Membrane fusion protein, cobalt-zinc-cadmium efflux system n=1 Tax=Sediminibacterium ginsengisoli TaxID=413434 RepID=A0A1T4KYR1_9BACT|nr:efflux RND transporter periplasmic adaptor subunit [Sediminibacterium ginsengisoli]SJZ47566.1 membrane fusion protein, cobalt-zinc-cadmium efflux system [Sediminibacterium ginsengisoli]